MAYMSDSEIGDRTYAKLVCVITNSLKSGLPITRQQSRACARERGFVVHFWDFRRNRENAVISTYALDMLIIGKRVDNDASCITAVSKELQLPNKLLSHSIDCGLQGYEFADCEINGRSLHKHLISLSNQLYHVGQNLQPLLKR